MSLGGKINGHQQYFIFIHWQYNINFTKKYKEVH